MAKVEEVKSRRPAKKGEGKLWGMLENGVGCFWQLEEKRGADEMGSSVKRSRAGK